MRDGNERLLDILEAIEEIERHAARGRDIFLQDGRSGGTVRNDVPPRNDCPQDRSLRRHQASRREHSEREHR
ncbi:hypothetical protein [uncultured Methanoculleus sp.]|jgi:hypothetical protein|uniref:hypothetical protein n=1 Tax=uncultured Methanoculleus sp. TaxID=183762 RepID=UPI003204AAC5